MSKSRRDYKNLAPGEHYHVFNRGTGQMPIFIDHSDYQFFLNRLKENLFPSTWAPSAGERYERKLLPEGSFTLVAYCLMPNHFHFLIRQNTELSISALMVKVCGGYSKYFNKKYNRVGSVFQDQFKAAHIHSNTSIMWVSSYIHQNPKVANLVSNLSDYAYSSYREYLAKGASGLCDKSIIEEQFKDSAHYHQFVETSYDSIRHKKELASLLID